MAKVTDLSGIKQIIRPLVESGTLVRRTDEEVRALALSHFCINLIILSILTDLFTYILQREEYKYDCT